VQELLAHPAVQGGLAPLLAGMAVALVLCPVRLSGLAAACGFFAAVYLTRQLDFDKKLLMVSLAAPVLGALADLAFRPTRAAGVVLGIVFGLATFWVFLSQIGGLPAQRLVLYALGVTTLLAATVAFSVLSQNEPARAGAAGIGLALAVGAIALLGGANVLALWSFGLAAGCAGFLIIALILGKRVAAGASFALSIGVIGALLAAAVVLQRGLPWYYGALLALVPLAVRMPVPRRSLAAQAAVALLYALAIGGAVCALLWMAR
jgi:hypothetical protein